MSPKKPLTESSLTLIQNLLMCTTNEENCPIHSPNLPEVQWSVMYKPEHIEALIESLNKRGIREGELRQCMELEKNDIISYISRCPISSLNPIEVPPAIKPDVQTRLTKRYAEANLRFPAGTDINEVLEMTLRDALVDMEEKVYLGCLGELRVKDRVTWSETILKRDYDKQCLKLSWGPNRSISDDLQIINGNTKPDECN
jgi:bromodomain adjacent to zinc finger domain protein 1A